MVSSVCDGKWDHSTHCVMGSWTAQLTVGQDANVIQKDVFLMKRSRLAIRLFWGGQPSQLLCNLCSYFALCHPINKYFIHICLVIWPVDPVYLSYKFCNYEFSFTGFLICLFRQVCIHWQLSLTGVLFWLEHFCWYCCFVCVFWEDLNGFRW